MFYVGGFIELTCEACKGFTFCALWLLLYPGASCVLSCSEMDNYVTPWLIPCLFCASFSIRLEDPGLYFQSEYISALPDQISVVPNDWEPWRVS
ncbi:unnamed protein product [Lathyrus sativus]|nr:unnamed protein product [Lathyrus sativus]